MKAFSLHKALVDHLEDFLTNTGGFPPLFKESASEEPSADTEHLMEYVLNSDSNPIGISNTDSDLTRGFYQIDCNVPKGHGKYNVLDIADRVSEGFPKGLILTHGGQQVKIGTTSWSPVRENDTSNVVNLRIRFTVIG